MNTKDLNRRLGSMNLRSFLLSWRMAEGLSQKEFSDLIGISPANLCDIEKGRKGISPKKASEIAATIGYSEKVLVELALKELLEREGLDWNITLKRKAS